MLIFNFHSLRMCFVILRSSFVVCCISPSTCLGVDFGLKRLFLDGIPTTRLLAHQSFFTTWFLPLNPILSTFSAPKPYFQFFPSSDLFTFPLKKEHSSIYLSTYPFITYQIQGWSYFLDYFHYHPPWLSHMHSSTWDNLP